MLHALKKKAKKLRDFLFPRVYINTRLEREIVDQFHKLYYDSKKFGKSWGDTFWLGVPVLKCPFDLWVYQEIIFELKPDKIIECGTAHGGSTLFLACMCALVDNGRVISIDIENRKGKPSHKRIEYLIGSSVSKEIVDFISRQIGERDRVMVILDSDHRKEHVLQELRIYSKFVTKDSYIIVEDTNINGHPVFPEVGPGPFEAVLDFVKEGKSFDIDKSKEKFFLTFNPNGYLKRIR